MKPINFTNHECLLCKKNEKEFICKNRRSIGNHLRRSHYEYDTEKYVLDFFCGGRVPLCLCGCEENVKWHKTKYKYNDYIVGHNANAHFSSENQPNWSPEKLKERQKKKEKTMMDRYDAKHPTENPEIKKKMDENRLKTQQTEEYKEKLSKAQKKVWKNDPKKKQKTEKYDKIEKEHKDEIARFIKSLGIQTSQNSRSVISPKELDIYVPDYNFAIEYNGLYWHSELYVDKNYHLNKTIECENKGIKLFHIFSDEWENKSEIIKSMIKYQLGKSEFKIGARKCEIKEIDRKLANSFFDESHISGGVRCKKAFGLFFQENLVSAISFRKTWAKKKYGANCMEIARFASKLNHHISGGFSKLLKHSLPWIGQENIEILISYADRQFSTGNLYERCGFFDQKEKTPISYGYTDFIQRYNRFKFRAQPGKTEKEVAEENNVFKIYGVGNFVFIKRF